MGQAPEDLFIDNAGHSIYVKDDPGAGAAMVIVDEGNGSIGRSLSRHADAGLQEDEIQPTLPLVAFTFAQELGGTLRLTALPRTAHPRLQPRPTRRHKFA